MATSTYLSYSRPHFSNLRDSYTPNKYSTSSLSSSGYHRPSTSLSKPTSSFYNTPSSQYQPTLSQAVRDFSRELDQIFLEKQKSYTNYNTPTRSTSTKSFLGQSRITPSTQNTNSHYRTNSSLLSQKYSRNISDFSDDLFDTPIKPQNLFKRDDSSLYSTINNNSNSNRFSMTQSQSFYSSQKQSNYSNVERGVLPPNRSGKKYTLVLDLDETLTHTLSGIGNRINFLKRPGVEEFLNEMSQYFEIVIFTAAMQEYADEIVDQIDPYCTISHRLYRQHLTIYRGEYIKDLSILGRDLSKTLIIDNLRSNFVAQPSNGYEIQEFRGQAYDNVLRGLARCLRNMVLNKVEDVRLYPIRI